MQTHEFNAQIDRLRSVYGDKSYPDERARLLWRSVGALSGDWFESVVDGLIQTCKWAPLHNEFWPLISDERERLYRIEKDKHAVQTEKTVFACAWCRDNGTYVGIQNADRSRPYAFRCNCSAGIRDPRKKIPQFKQAHADQGFRYYDIDWAKCVTLAGGR